MVLLPYFILVSSVLLAQIDVVVYRATPGGIAAAIQVKRAGKKVVIIEPKKRIGGIMTNGLSASDVCDRRFIGGIAKEFFQRVGQEYQKSVSWRFEPKVGLKVFKSMASNIPVFRSDIENVIVENHKITEIQLKNGQIISARIYIDASYEGDLMAKAGVTYTVGREGRAVYGESYAGYYLSKGQGQINLNLPSRDKDGSLLCGVHSTTNKSPGQGDSKIMAYNFRLCLTKVKSNQVAFVKPEVYDRRQYLLLAKYIRLKPVKKIDQILNLLPIPNSKFDLNNRGPLSTNFVGENWEYPEGDETTRAEIVKKHREYLQGLLYFLSRDSLVPPRLQLQMRRYGLCRDEFVDTNHWPEQLYVRVARRMVGRYVLKQQDLQKSRKHWDSVATGTCPIESHIVQRVEVEGKYVKTEGFVREYVYKPYSIPYRSITPKYEEIRNLLVPVAFSASHIAYSGARMEPTFMMLGQAAGIASELALENDTSVQEINYSSLRSRLEAAGIRLRF